MIARPLPRPGPIPFANTALQMALPTVGAAWPQGHTLPTRMASPSRMHDAPAPTTAHAEVRRTPPRLLHATFLGHGVLSVRSSASGALYRFDGHGARLPIDPRDALLLGRLTDVHVD